MAEWSIALDCKSGALRASKVQILLAAPTYTKYPTKGYFVYEILKKVVDE